MSASAAGEGAEVPASAPLDSGNAAVLHASGSVRATGEVLRLRSIFSGERQDPASVRTDNGTQYDSAGPRRTGAPSFASTNAEATSREAASAKLPKTYTTTTFLKHAVSFERKAVDRFGHKHSGWLHTLFLAYSTVGTIYGDLGTSPLYTVGSVFGILDNDPQELDFLGVASCIFWTLTLVPLVKYVFIVLFADDMGEGGTFALYSNLCRHARISLMGSRMRPEMKEQLAQDFPSAAATERPPQHSCDLESVPVGPTVCSAKQDRGGGGLVSRLVPRGGRKLMKGALERSWGMRQAVLVLTLLGTCGVLSDGVLTPSISVLSAVGGLTSRVALSQGAGVGISCAVLLLLFLAQQLGTHRISAAFSPIILVWLLSIAGVGVYNIATCMPSAFKAISPWYAFQYFARNKFLAWEALGDIVLCITGAEALFADMGHFNRLSIQLTFSLLVYPCVLLSYFGQIAFLVRNPDQAANAFYASVPTPVFWPMFVVATLAAVVASQALITGAFSIIKQSMSLSCFPRSAIVHTSRKHEGQVYIPAVNWTLLALTIAVTAGFRDAAAIGNAYGVTVTMVMLLTTTLVSFVMMVSWDLSPLLVLPFWLFYSAFEGLFFSSTLYKVPDGGWFPLVLSVVLLFVMYTWHFGTYKKRHFAREHSVGDAALLTLLDAAAPVAGAAIVYSEEESGVPPVLVHWLSNVPAIQQMVVFLTVKRLPVPRLDDDHRLFVARLTLPRATGQKLHGFYRAMAFYGYMETVDHGAGFLDLLSLHVSQSAAGEAPGGELRRSLEEMSHGASAWQASIRRDSLDAKGRMSGAAEDPEPKREAPATLPTVGPTKSVAASADAAGGSLLRDAASPEACANEIEVRSDSQLWRWRRDAYADSTAGGARGAAPAGTAGTAVDDQWGFNQVYFMGRTTTVVGQHAKLSTRVLIPVYTLLRSISGNQAGNYQVPAERLLEVGMVYTLT